MGKLWDALLISVLWIVTSLPILTIGASTTAVYYAALKLARNEETYVVKQFFKSFASNFRQATIVWLLEAVIGAALGFNVYYFYKDDAFSVIIFGFFVMVIFFFIGYHHYIYAIIAKFSNSLKNLIVMAAFFTFRNIGWTLLMMLITAAFLVGIRFFPPLIIPAMGWAAFAHAFILSRIFNGYIRNYMHLDPQTGQELVQNEAGDYVVPAGKEILTEDVDMSLFEIRNGEKEKNEQ